VRIVRLHISCALARMGLTSLGRPACSVLGCWFPSLAEGGMIGVMLALNVLVFAIFFWELLGRDGPTIDCGDLAGPDCEDAPVGRAAAYMIRLNLALVWLPVCRNTVWVACGAGVREPPAWGCTCILTGGAGHMPAQAYIVG
jgi:hypothetical protein